jgi:DNA-directed RNA polymerase subunit RPC12/RpoP/SAM-dependent methyltransferase
MCGGGVTIIEGLRLRRRVIGVDLNPMATFITKMEAIDIDLDKFRQAFSAVSDRVKDEINNLYLTKCQKCGKEVPGEWFEWSGIVECTKCRKNVIFAESKRLTGGTYKCPNCGQQIKTSQAKRLGDEMILLKVKCDCGFESEKVPDSADLKRYDGIESSFAGLVQRRKLEIPQDEFPDADRQKDDAVYQKGIRYFRDFFTTRNLLACAFLKRTILDCGASQDIIDLLMLTFSSTLNWATKLCYRKKGVPVGWGSHSYWVPDTTAEVNIWNSFVNRYKAVLKGKQESNAEIGDYFQEASDFKALNDSKTCLLLTQSAVKLPLPDASVDAIITDPPYGGNVQYSELCNFYIAWLKETTLDVDAILDNKLEAVQTRHTGHRYVKSLNDYRRVLYEIFEECYRVLKPGRWMVMTFHNREFRIWNAIHLAAHDAGFVWSERDGMIYQPPIQAYTTTLHQRAAGSMLGDFILSYQKAEALPEEKWIEEAEIGIKIKEIAGQAIEYHGGAKLTTIYTRLMPFLLNSGLLEKMTDRDLEPYLRKYFVRKDDKWYLPEVRIDKVAEAKVEEYAPVEARVESIIRRFLYTKHRATMDEILQVVYSRLINSNAAEYEEIVHVINRICIKVAGDGGKAVYQLKEERDRELLFKLPEEKVEEYRYSEESDHDTIIEQLARIGKNRDYESHIGLTEQNKDRNFRELSIPMGSNVQFGLDQIAFNRIREIDLLWIKGISIMAAFEVEVSTSIDSGITRFRELFAATPVLNIPAYIIIPDKREKEARNKIGSLANRREGITERVKYILFSDILGKEDVNTSKVAKGVHYA